MAFAAYAMRKGRRRCLCLMRGSMQRQRVVCDIERLRSKRDI